MNCTLTRTVPELAELTRPQTPASDVPRSRIFADVLYDGPLRRLDHRWQLALHLLDGPDPRLRRHADEDVEEAVRYLCALRDAERQGDPSLPEELFPEIAGAYELSQQTPPHRRWAVEARVLARQSAEAIAERECLSPGVIASYERLFFDCRAKLHSRDWVMCCVVGSKAFTGMTPGDLDVLWKLVGYLYGPLTLDLVMRFSLHPPGDPLPGADGGSLDSETRLALSVKAFIAVTTMPPDQFTAPGLLRLYLRLLKLEQDQPTTTQIPHSRDAHLRAFQDELSRLSAEDSADPGETAPPGANAPGQTTESDADSKEMDQKPQDGEQGVGTGPDCVTVTQAAG